MGGRWRWWGGDFYCRYGRLILAVPGLSGFREVYFPWRPHVPRTGKKIHNDNVFLENSAIFHKILSWLGDPPSTEKYGPYCFVVLSVVCCVVSVSLFLFLSVFSAHCFGYRPLRHPRTDGLFATSCHCNTLSPPGIEGARPIAMATPYALSGLLSFHLFNGRLFL